MRVPLLSVNEKNKARRDLRDDGFVFWTTFARDVDVTILPESQHPDPDDAKASSTTGFSLGQGLYCVRGQNKQDPSWYQVNILPSADFFQKHKREIGGDEHELVDLAREMVFIKRKHAGVIPMLMPESLRPMVPAFIQMLKCKRQLPNLGHARLKRFGIMTDLSHANIFNIFCKHPRMYQITCIEELNLVMLKKSKSKQEVNMPGTTPPSSKPLQNAPAVPASDQPPPEAVLSSSFEQQRNHQHQHQHQHQQHNYEQRHQRAPPQQQRPTPDSIMHALRQELSLQGQKQKEQSSIIQKLQHELRQRTEELAIKSKQLSTHVTMIAELQKCMRDRDTTVNRLCQKISVLETWAKQSNLWAGLDVEWNISMVETEDAGPNLSHQSTAGRSSMSMDTQTYQKMWPPVVHGSLRHDIPNLALDHDHNNDDDWMNDINLGMCNGTFQVPTTV